MCEDYAHSLNLEKFIKKNQQGKWIENYSQILNPGFLCMLHTFKLSNYEFCVLEMTHILENAYNYF